MEHVKRKATSQLLLYSVTCKGEKHYIMRWKNREQEGTSTYKFTNKNIRCGLSNQISLVLISKKLFINLQQCVFLQKLYGSDGRQLG